MRPWSPHLASYRTSSQGTLPPRRRPFGSRRSCLAAGEAPGRPATPRGCWSCTTPLQRSEEHTSELQSRPHLVCRLLLEKKKKNKSSALKRRTKKKKTKQ